MAKAVKTATAAVPAENRSYFLTYLVPTTFTDSEINSIKESVTKLVTKFKGQVLKAEDWGKRRMAYKIKHSGKWHTEAVYVHVTFSVDPANVQSLERDVHLNQSLMRHLLVLADDSVKAEAQV